MDPTATLKRAKSAIEDGDFEEARDALDDYWEWRGRKGFQPPNGDKRAREMGKQIGDEYLDEKSDSDFDRDEVIEGFASAIWSVAWMEACERAVEDGELDDLPFGAGDDISEVAPETPDKARAIAKQELARMERVNKKKMTLEDLFTRAQAARYDAPADSSELGYQIGMQWLGTGVGLPHEGREWTVGHGEVMVDLPDGDPDNAEISYASGQHLAGLGEDSLASDTSHVKRLVSTHGYLPLSRALTRDVVAEVGDPLPKGPVFLVKLKRRGSADEIRNLRTIIGKADSQREWEAGFYGDERYAMIAVF